LTTSAISIGLSYKDKHLFTSSNTELKLDGCLGNYNDYQDLDVINTYSRELKQKNVVDE